MKTLIKTKLLENKYWEVREYELFKTPLKLIYCQVDDYKNHDHIGDLFQTLTLEQQKKGKVTNTQQSKFPPYSYYRMYKFLFKPKGTVESIPLSERKITYVGNRAIIE